MRLIFAALLLLATLPAHADAVLDRVTQNKTLTIAMVPGRPPHSYWNDEHDIVGFDVDLSRAIAKELGVIPKFVHPRWEDIVAGEWQGKWDVAISSMTPLKSRLEKLDFPVIYTYLPVSAAVHRNNRTITNFYDLDGKSVGVCNNCSFDKYLRRNLEIDHSVAPVFAYKVFPGNITNYESDDEAFRDLEAGDGTRLDAVVSSRLSIGHYITMGKPFKMLENSLYYEPLAIAVEKNTPEFSNKIADAVGKLTASGQLREISYKWFDADYTRPGK
ncbi:MAG: transporter substrate-binding domain-containing protein [Alphaproteobacteria bacterium]|nr:transporter substrate-binding domain-containing protein [Alphaproteobacteria bacterium]